MLILYPDDTQSAETIPQAMVIFGLGLLGHSIFQSISKTAASLNQQSMAFDWNPGKLQKSHADSILRRLTDITNDSPISSKRLVILWSAGSAGFSSSHKEIDKELTSFHVVLDMAKQLQVSFPQRSVEFHLLSSAGGLFEGCTYVTEQTGPVPCRPYGYLKQEQEQQLLNQDLLVPVIYRPSTVYGPISAGVRRGLVSTLIHNGTLRIVSNILGHFSTLRDYVYFEDIANFIAGNILSGPTPRQGPVNYLISGKPTSIYEIIKTIESILRHPLYYQLKYDPDNRCDMAFSPSLFPTHWRPTDLYFGCNNIFNFWRATGIERTFYT